MPKNFARLIFLFSVAIFSFAATEVFAAPAAPSDLIATTISSTEIRLSWKDNANDEMGFKIERCQGAGCTNWDVAAFVGPNPGSGGTVFYNNTPLIPGPTYYYRIKAHNALGDSNPSNVAGAPTAKPADPSNLSAAAISSSRIDLKWADNSDGETGFRIERCQGAGCTNFGEIGTTGANAISYANTGLSANTTYVYRVRAYNAIGNSGYTNTASATTQQTPPAAPSGLNATTISKSQINLSWTDGSSNESGFRIERKTGSGGSWAEIGTTGQNATSYSAIGLNSGTQYFFRVRAYNNGGNSAYSNEANATTWALNPPTNLTATAISASQINLSWNGADILASGFRIERKTGSGGSWAEIGTTGQNTTSYQNTGLSPSTTYYYRLRAYNLVGNSPYSNEANATTLQAPPATPTNLAATAISASQINLSWTDASNNEAGFRIERKTGSGGTYAEITTVGQNQTSYANTGLTQTTQYFYRIRAYHNDGNSAYSNEANATTLTPNPVPTISSISQTSMTLNAAPSAGVIITGNNFISSSVVEFGAIPLAPISIAYTFNSATQLTVLPNQVGSLSGLNNLSTGTFTVTVTNPAPGGGTATAAQTFTVNNPAPVLTSISPDSTTIGSPQFTLTATGTGFIVNSRIKWNGADRTTSFVSSTQITATIPASDLTALGTFPITIFNSGPGGGTSGAQNFTVNPPPNPVPVITGINPSSATAGDPGFTLTVSGSNFISSSVVRWNGQNRTTTFVSATQLTAAIPASDTAAPGQGLVNVFNPAPGGGLSVATLTFSINTSIPKPSIASIIPAAYAQGTAPSQGLVITGTGFVVGNSAVKVNGSLISGSFIKIDSSTKITILGPGSSPSSNYLNGLSVGPYSVVVRNVAAGVDKNSDPVPFTVTALTLDHFEFANITSPKTAGQAFGIVITAKAVNNVTISNFTGTANLTTTAGSITPTTVNFTNGTWQGDVTVTQAGAGKTITATHNSGATGTSNPFTVNPGAAHHFDFDTISSPQTPGVAFDVVVTAKDVNNNTASNWNPSFSGDKYNFTTTANSIVPTSFNAGGFVNGSRTFPITLTGTSPPQKTITVTYSSNVAINQMTGTSNLFTLGTPPPTEGKLVIKKDTIGGDDKFDFYILGIPQPEKKASVTTSGGTGSTSAISVNASTVYTIQEVATIGWKLKPTPSCRIDVNNTPNNISDDTPTGTATGNSIAGVTITAGKTTTCTFVNEIVPEEPCGTAGAGGISKKLALKGGSLAANHLTNNNCGWMRIIKKSGFVTSTFEFEFKGGVPTNKVIHTTQTWSDGVKWSRTPEFIMVPGEHTVREKPKSGWVPVAASCHINPGLASPPTLDPLIPVGTPSADFYSVAGIQIAAGQHVQCEFENTPIDPTKGSIKVVKQSVGGFGSFNFTGSLGNFSLETTAANNTKERTFYNLNPQSTYNISETPINGWATSVSCVDEDGADSGSFGTNSVTGVKVFAGKTTTCTFTNHFGAPTGTGTLRIIKNTAGVARDENFFFWLNPGPTIDPIGTRIEVNEPNTKDIQVTAGEYDVVESFQNDTKWEFISVSCKKEDGTDATGDSGPSGWYDLIIEASKTTTCTFENRKRGTTIEIIKTIVIRAGLPGGIAGILPVPLTYTVTNQQDGIAFPIQVPAARFVLTNPGGAHESWRARVVREIPHGIYRVSEQGQQGFTMGAIMALGPDNAERGDPQLDRSRTNIQVNQGENVRILQTNSSAAISSGATFLQIMKSASGGDGVFKFLVWGPTPWNPQLVTKDGYDSAIRVVVPGNNYSIIETLPPSFNFFDVYCWNDSGMINITPFIPAYGVKNLNVAAGQTTTCVFENQKKPTPPIGEGPRGKIKIVKETTGGNATFFFDVENTSGATVWSPQLATVNGTWTEDHEVAVGTYSVSEAKLDDWKLESASCGQGNFDAQSGKVSSISVTEGQIVECRFRNKYDSSAGKGKIKIVKETTSGNGTFTFSVTNETTGATIDWPQMTTAPSPPPADQNMGTKTEDKEVPGGTYSITEISPSGWKLKSATCGGQSTFDPKTNTVSNIIVNADSQNTGGQCGSDYDACLERCAEGDDDFCIENCVDQYNACQEGGGAAGGTGGGAGTGQDANPGEIIECKFENVKTGLLNIIKKINGQADSDTTFNFQIKP